MFYEWLHVSYNTDVSITGRASSYTDSINFSALAFLPGVSPHLDNNINLLISESKRLHSE